MTSGEEPLAITPIKDVGFPYQSHQVFEAAGGAIDRAMPPFSWQQYLIEQARLCPLGNAGSPAVQHREYGRYLAWVLSRANQGVNARARPRHAGVAADAAPAGWARRRRRVLGGRSATSCGALALTGPGVHRPLAHDPDAAPRIFHCDSRRNEFARIPPDPSADIAIVGGGESALSCVAFLRAFRPDAQLTVYTTGLPLSRGESFLENRVFSNPDDVDGARSISSCAVTSSSTATAGSSIPTASRASPMTRPVASSSVASCTSPAGRQRCVSLHAHSSTDEPVCARHDFVVNCTGFDALAQLRELLSARAREEIERRTGRTVGRTARRRDPDRTIPRAEGRLASSTRSRAGGAEPGPGVANLGSLAGSPTACSSHCCSTTTTSMQSPA